jgi:hypothetical protein
LNSGVYDLSLLFKISSEIVLELDPAIHQEIVQRAVELAKAAYSSDQSGQAQMQNQITIGQRSE